MPDARWTLALERGPAQRTYLYQGNAGINAIRDDSIFPQILIGHDSRFIWPLFRIPSVKFLAFWRTKMQVYVMNQGREQNEKKIRQIEENYCWTNDPIGAWQCKFSYVCGNTYVHRILSVGSEANESLRRLNALFWSARNSRKLLSQDWIRTMSIPSIIIQTNLPSNQTDGHSALPIIWTIYLIHTGKWILFKKNIFILRIR